jgi:hypothetical protein
MVRSENFINNNWMPGQFLEKETPGNFSPLMLDFGQLGNFIRCRLVIACELFGNTTYILAVTRCR